MPWGFVSEDCIEDCQQLAGDGDEGDHFGLAAGDETLMESLQERIVARGDEGALEEGGADAGTASADAALAAPALRGWECRRLTAEAL